jgi:hypothetical protein
MLENYERVMFEKVNVDTDLRIICDPKQKLDLHFLPKKELSG